LSQSRLIKNERKRGYEKIRPWQATNNNKTVGRLCESLEHYRLIEKTRYQILPGRQPEDAACSKRRHLLKDIKNVPNFEQKKAARITRV